MADDTHAIEIVQGVVDRQETILLDGTGDGDLTRRQIVGIVDQEDKMVRDGLVTAIGGGQGDGQRAGIRAARGAAED